MNTIYRRLILVQGINVHAKKEAAAVATIDAPPALTKRKEEGPDDDPTQIPIYKVGFKRSRRYQTSLFTFRSRCPRSISTVPNVSPSPHYCAPSNSTALTRLIGMTKRLAAHAKQANGSTTKLAVSATVTRFWLSMRPALSAATAREFLMKSIYGY